MDKLVASYYERYKILQKKERKLGQISSKDYEKKECNPCIFM